MNFAGFRPVSSLTSLGVRSHFKTPLEQMTPSDGDYTEICKSNASIQDSFPTNSDFCLLTVKDFLRA